MTINMHIFCRTFLMATVSSTVGFAAMSFFIDAESLGWRSTSKGNPAEDALEKLEAEIAHVIFQDTEDRVLFADWEERLEKAVTGREWDYDTVRRMLLRRRSPTLVLAGLMYSALRLKKHLPELYLKSLTGEFNCILSPKVVVKALEGLTPDDDVAKSFDRGMKALLEWLYRQDDESRNRLAQYAVGCVSRGCDRLLMHWAGQKESKYLIEKIPKEFQMHIVYLSFEETGTAKQKGQKKVPWSIQELYEAFKEYKDDRLGYYIGYKKCGYDTLRPLLLKLFESKDVTSVGVWAALARHREVVRGKTELLKVKFGSPEVARAVKWFVEGMPED